LYSAVVIETIYLPFLQMYDGKVEVKLQGGVKSCDAGLRQAQPPDAAMQICWRLSVSKPGVME